MSVRHVKQGEQLHCAGCEANETHEAVVPATACVAHRCNEHAAVPPTNDAGPDQSECGMCLAQKLARGYEQALEKQLFWPVVTTARDRMNLLSPGTGDRFLEEARATINAAGLAEPPTPIVRLRNVDTGEIVEMPIVDDLNLPRWRIGAGTYECELFEED